MARARPEVPEGHGELVAQPAYREWAGLVARNREAAGRWEFLVAGVHVRELRAEAARSSRERASRYSSRLGVPVQDAGGPERPIVGTGHQPELYHPGVWVKDFLLQRIATQTGATPVDVVVDTDGFDAVAFSAPCLDPVPRQCRQYLAVGGRESFFAGSPVPDEAHISAFCETSASVLDGLGSPAPARHFREFCGALHDAAGTARSLGDLVTIARRRYEQPAGTDYLELPVTELISTDPYLRFLTHVILEAARFASDYNDELAAYRAASGTRSAAQPFPDLRVTADRFELPFWRLVDGRRRMVTCARGADGSSALVDEDGEFLLLPPDAEDAFAALRESGEAIAPKAVPLTMFVRLFVADLFIHGIGGGRYDRVTDGVIRRHFGVEPPAFVVASLTLLLPTGAAIAGPDDVSEARERVNRLKNSPEEALGEIDFERVEERERAGELVAEKRRLVVEIGVPGSDKKRLGLAIREVNKELATIVAPARRKREEALQRVEAAHAMTQVLADRTYPFCLWDPREVADKAW